MIPTSEIRPRAAWYWVGGGVILFGVIAAIAVFVVAFKEPFEEIVELDRQIDDMSRFTVPGQETVFLDGTGEFILYAEGPGAASGFGTFDLAAVTVEPLRGEPTEVPVRSVRFEETYDFGGPSGRASLEFTVDDPGEYRITVDDAPPGVTRAAVGRRLDLLGVIASTAVAIFVPMGVGAVFVLLGGVVLIVTGVRRSGSAKRLRMAAAPPPPPGGWAPPATPGTPGAPPRWPPPSDPSPPPR